jgi:hypothetical protein
LLLDPCWSVFGTPMKVVCPESPWSLRAFVLTLTEPLPLDRQNEFSRAEPWALKLENGRRCIHLAGGTSSPVAGEHPTYVCGRDEIIGAPITSGRVWEVFFARRGSTEIRTARVRTAWF